MEGECSSLDTTQCFLISSPTFGDRPKLTFPPGSSGELCWHGTRTLKFSQAPSGFAQLFDSFSLPKITYRSSEGLQTGLLRWATCGMPFAGAHNGPRVLFRYIPNPSAVLIEFSRWRINKPILAPASICEQTPPACGRAM